MISLLDLPIILNEHLPMFGEPDEDGKRTLVLFVLFDGPPQTVHVLPDLQDLFVLAIEEFNRNGRRGGPPPMWQFVARAELGAKAARGIAAMHHPDGLDTHH